MDMSSLAAALLNVCPICEIHILSEKDKIKDKHCSECRNKAKKQAECDTIREFFFFSF
jgi:hypothetical protein